jgi:hypothetical protein
MKRGSNTVLPFAGYETSALPARLARYLDSVPAWPEIPGRPDLPFGGTAVLTLPTARLEHVQTIAAPGVLPGRVVVLAAAPGTDADETPAEMLDLRLLSGEAGTDLITVTATFDVPTVGAVAIIWSAI